MASKRKIVAVVEVPKKRQTRAKEGQNLAAPTEDLQVQNPISEIVPIQDPPIEIQSSQDEL